MRKERIYIPGKGRKPEGHVVYWMSRDQRVKDNWALVHALQLARQLDAKIYVAFTLVPDFLEATLRQYDFMLRGLQEVETVLRQLNIPFVMLLGNPPEEILKFARSVKAKSIVTDFDPLRIKREWRNQAFGDSDIYFAEVDAHNIVPARFVSQKTEFAAYTIRPKIHKQLDKFLEEFPGLKPLNQKTIDHAAVNWDQLTDSLDINRDISPVKHLVPGEKAALKAFQDFLEHRLERYADQRNDPNAEAISNLSPYLHFGQISAQRIALEIITQQPRSGSTDAFLEELIVRRELADNFCLYNPDYDKPEGFHDWAKKTHEAHRKDEREYTYSRDAFEKGQTHDPLWNAAQIEMVKSGKMHGYMRMYWAKKILEWTRNVGEAMQVAIYLNDKYELDGRDPNGYAGIAWSIGGVHDRAWTERPVFGKIRYMNYNGAKRKFDVPAYIRKVNSL